LITGAAGAIGGALARALSARFERAALTLVDVDEAGVTAIAADLGARARARVWDLTKPERLEPALRAAEAEHGPVHMLVNCAGIMEVCNFATTSWQTAERVLSVDLTSPLRLMSLVVPSMVARGSGWVINVSSLAGVTPLRGCSYYGAAKAGLAHASEIARIELAPRGVRVLTVYPGPVRSGLERRARDQFAQSRARDWIPTGDPEPLARAVLRAVERGAARVVYPRIYGVANRAPRIAGFITARISPEPRS
jgi:short-subunit dehydrogenase